MAERNEKAVLTHLIATCRDDARDLLTAAEHTKDAALKKFFSELAAERNRFVEELMPHAQRLGAVPGETSGSTSEALYRRWMSIKGAITGNDRRIAIEEAEHGEDMTLRAYREALGGMLPPTVRDLVERQAAAVEASHERVRALEEARR